MLIRTGQDTFYFAWSSHHILIDGWCRQVIIGEVFRLYEARRDGRELSLPQPGAYRDYVAWLQRQDEKKAEEFWRKELRGFSEPTRLWIDRVREGDEGGRQEYRKQELRLPRELTEKLEQMARRRQITVNNVVQGAWGVLLGRHSGQGVVGFGATVWGRAA